MHRHGRQLLHVVHEAAVAVDRDDLLVRVAHLRAERRRKAIAERSLVAGGEVGARLVDREGVVHPVTNLGALAHHDAVVRKLFADRRGEGGLWLHLEKDRRRDSFGAAISSRRDSPLRLSIELGRAGRSGQAWRRRRSRCRGDVAPDLVRVDIHLDDCGAPPAVHCSSGWAGRSACRPRRSLIRHQFHAGVIVLGQLVPRREDALPLLDMMTGISSVSAISRNSSHASAAKCHRRRRRPGLSLAQRVGRLLQRVRIAGRRDGVIGSSVDVTAASARRAGSPSQPDGGDRRATGERLPHHAWRIVRRHGTPDHLVTERTISR